MSEQDGELVRTIAPPPGNLERVLRRLADLKREGGRGPRIGRPGEGVATLEANSAVLTAPSRTSPGHRTTPRSWRRTTGRQPKPDMSESLCSGVTVGPRVICGPWSP